VFAIENIIGIIYWTACQWCRHTHGCFFFK